MKILIALWITYSTISITKAIFPRPSGTARYFIIHVVIINAIIPEYLYILVEERYYLDYHALRNRRAQK